jgi:nitroreductase
VLSKHDDGIGIDNNNAFGCIACGHCMMVCPSGGIAVSGGRFSAADIVEMLSKDRRPDPEQIEALLLSRRSVRHFKPDAVPAAVLDRVIDAAASAPMGVPPWEIGVVVFAGRERVRELARDTANTYEGLLKFMDHSVLLSLMRPLMKKTVYDQFRTFILPLGRKIVEGRKAGEDWVLYDAPAALLFYNSPYADASESIGEISCNFNASSRENAPGFGF